jgi:hypothetical protein
LLSLAFPAAALVLCATWGPGSGPYRDLASYLGRVAQPGDLVVLTPSDQIDRLRHFSGTSLSVVAVSDPRVALRAGFPRLWVVTPPGGNRWSPLAEGPRGRVQVERSLRVSGLTLDLVTQPSAGARP